MNYLLPNCPINVDLLLSYNLKSDVADKKMEENEEKDN